VLACTLSFFFFLNLTTFAFVFHSRPCIDQRFHTNTMESYGLPRHGDVHFSPEPESHQDVNELDTPHSVAGTGMGMVSYP
jgi:hypothetical protein